MYTGRKVFWTTVLLISMMIAYGGVAIDGRITESIIALSFVIIAILGLRSPEKLFRYLLYALLINAASFSYAATKQIANPPYSNAVADAKIWYIVGLGPLIIYVIVWLAIKALHKHK